MQHWFNFYFTALTLISECVNVFFRTGEKLFEVPKDTFHEKKVTLIPFRQDKDIFSFPIKNLTAKFRQLSYYFRFIRFEQKQFFFFEKKKKRIFIIVHSTTSGRLKKNHDISLKFQWRWYEIFFLVWNEKASLDFWCPFFEKWGYFISNHH